jgi:hypothetical protein
MRNFEEDFIESNKSELKQEWINTLKRIFGFDSKVEFKESKETQLDFGVDFLVTQKTGRKFSVECKTKRYELMPLDSWVLEIVHHIYSDNTRTEKIKTKEGWLYCSTADYIIYGTLNESKNKIIEVCAFSLIPFKYEEFKKVISKLPTKFSSTIYPNGNYQITILKLASTEFLRNNANKFWYFKNENSN